MDHDGRTNRYCQEKLTMWLFTTVMLSMHPSKYLVHWSKDACFRLSSGLFILHVETLRRFCGAVQESSESISGITLRYGFCALARWKMSLYIKKNSAAVFASRERVPLFFKSMNDAFHVGSDSFVGFIHLVVLACNVVVFRSKFLSFSACPGETRINPFLGEPIV